MNAQEQLDRLTEAARLVGEVQFWRMKQKTSCDDRVADVCYKARCSIEEVRGECLCDLGIRERKIYSCICIEPAVKAETRP